MAAIPVEIFIEKTGRQIQNVAILQKGTDRKSGDKQTVNVCMLRCSLGTGVLGGFWHWHSGS